MSDEIYPLPHFSTDLVGKVAVITGASAGLGRRFTRVLAAAGAAVVPVGRRQERLEQVKQEVEAAGGKCLPVVADIVEADAITRIVDEAEAAFGTVTILVNNAGIPDAKRAHRMPLSVVDAVIDTNLRAPFLLSAEVARRLIAASTPGRIVNISSIGAYHYDGGAASLYSVTKAGVNRLTEVLAVEWVKYGINVNGIAPGAFDTEMMHGLIERIGDPSGSLPRKRIGHVALLDSTLLYLVSPSSEFVTGTIIKVDDGQRPR